MFFRKIKLENFHSHVNTTLDLAPLTVIRGTNGCGKSSIEDAIEITLAGRAPATTSDGKGASGYIRAGAAKGLVTLAIQSDGQERVVTCALNDTRRSVLATDPANPQWGGASDYLDSLVVHRDVLSCLCNNRFFVDLAEDRQKDILAAIILPKTYTWAEWVMPAFATLGLKINWAKTPFEVITQAYDVAFKARTDVNRDLKNFRMPEGDTAEAANLEDYSHRVGDLRQQLDAAKKEKYDAEGAGRLRAATLSAAEERLRATTARLEREREAISAMEADLLSPSKLKEHKKAAESAAKAASLEADIIRLDAEIAANKDAVRKINALSSGDAICPTCQSAITANVVQAIAQPLMEARLGLDRKREEAIQSRKALGNSAQSKSLVEAHGKAEQDLKRAQSRIAEEQVAIRDAEAAIAEAGNTQGARMDTREIDARIADLTARLERGSDAVVIARAAKDLQGRVEAARQEQSFLLEKQKSLNMLLDYFGPEGVQKQLLEKHVGPFVVSMNAVLASWGYQCVLAMEPYRFSILFGLGSIGSIPIGLKHLSKSQRYRFSTAFQVALALVSGFKFVIVDESDIYDADGRAGLFEALLDSGLDQVIVMGTDERESIPDLPNSIFYRLDDTAQPGHLATTQARRLYPAVEKAA